MVKHSYAYGAAEYTPTHWQEPHESSTAHTVALTVQRAAGRSCGDQSQSPASPWKGISSEGSKLSIRKKAYHLDRPHLIIHLKGASGVDVSCMALSKGSKEGMNVRPQLRH
eukprot:scaffold168623_cov27-Prasinocladus_malaysianus.AAC.1